MSQEACHARYLPWRGHKVARATDWLSVSGHLLFTSGHLCDQARLAGVSALKARVMASMAQQAAPANDLRLVILSLLFEGVGLLDREQKSFHHEKIIKTM